MSMKKQKADKEMEKLKNLNQQESSLDQNNSIKLGNQFLYFSYISRYSINPLYSTLLLDSNNPFTIRQIAFPKSQQIIDTNSNNHTDEPHQEILLDLGERSVPSSIGFTMMIKTIPQKQQQTTNVKMDDSEQFNQISQQSKKERNRLQSLKNLSLLVKNFIGQHKETTYKSMADLLIQDLKGDIQSKDNQNLKRRVYDSINVMVALGVLEKEKKIITKGPMFHYSQNCNYEKKVLDKLNKQKLEQVQILTEKKRLFSDWTKRLRSLDLLIQQNKHTLQSEVCLTAPQSTKYYFPIVMFYQKQPYNVDIDMKQDKTELMVQSQQPINHFGDFDVLKQISRILPQSDRNDKQIQDQKET